MTDHDPYAVLRKINPDAIVFGDFDDACVGYVQAKGSEAVACYDFQRCVEILISEGSTCEEALEHLTYNTLDADHGPHTPAFLFEAHDE